ncbi:hypothetical protein B0O80DRAFT_495570 [Mortierella sp. GBAus27b]|nr:hypothetical protein B0O80DRAFT_495570 [Mortierella sp. GBAus27b]
METTQSFRLAGTTDVLEIPCDQVDDQNVIYWDEITDIFPGAQYIKNGNIIVKKIRESISDRKKPQHIKHYPGVVLDVVLFAPGAPSKSDAASSQAEHSRIPGSCTTPHVNGSVVEDLQVSTSRDGGQVVQFTQRTALESTFEQRLVSFLPPDVQTQVLASSDVHECVVQAIQNRQMDRVHEQLIACLQVLKDEMTKSNELASKNNELVSDVKELALKNNEMASRNNELASKNMELTNQVLKLQETLGANQIEMKQLQVQALDQLALLQNRVQALMTQTYELHEYPIPRLFVVLPQDTSSWNPQDFFSNKFRLHFLCECGEHTKSTNSKIPHHIHLAKHEGYEISQPTEFFQQYGSYVLTILKMLKFGISVAGVAVPSLSHLLRTEALDQVTTNLKMFTGNTQKGLNQAIGCLEKITGGNGEAADEFSEQMRTNDALEGADLRKLDSFLKNSDGNKVLGNLYRTVTSEGHVKWVCIDHYRENYHEKAAKTFRDTVESLGGTFDENVGYVEIKLKSRIQAEQFYQALGKARSVYELKIGLAWETTQSEFKKLRDSLLVSNVGALYIDLKYQGGPTSDVLNRNKRYDPILDIMRHPPIQSVTITGARDFIKRSSLVSRNDDFSNLRHLAIGGGLQHDVPSVKAMISRAQNLSSLTFHETADNCLLIALYISVAEYLTCPMTLTDRSLCVQPPSTRLHRRLAAHQYLDHLLDHLVNVNDPNMGYIELHGYEHEEGVLEAFTKQERDRRYLKTINLCPSRGLGSQFIKKVATVVSRSELRSLCIDLRGEEERVQILESIQWKHIRRLTIQMDKESTGTRAMEALVEGRDKEKGQVELDYFRFYCRYSETVSSECAALCKSFVASTSIKDLVLVVQMTPSDTESVLNSMDVTRLERIGLRVIGYSTSEVDRVLDCLTNAHNLKAVQHCCFYTPTQEQIQRMQKRGVTLF